MFEHYKLEDIQNYIKNHHLDTQQISKQTRRIFILRRLTEGLIVTLFTYVGLFLGPFDEISTLLWPHSGVLLGILFLRGIRILPWIFIGSLIAAWQYSPNIKIMIFASSFVVLSTFVPYYLLHKIVGAVVPLSRLKVLIKTLLCFLILGPIFGSLYFYGINILEGEIYPKMFLWTSVLSFTLSWIIFTPICLIWDTYIPGLKHDYSKWTMILLSGIVILTNVTYCVTTNPLIIANAFILSLIMMWVITLFYGQMGCTLVCMVNGLFLLALKDLPGMTISQILQSAPLIMQSILLVNVGACLFISTRRKEAYFLRFVSEYKSLD